MYCANCTIIQILYRQKARIDGRKWDEYLTDAQVFGAEMTKGLLRYGRKFRNATAPLWES